MSTGPLPTYWSLVKSVLRRGTPLLGLELRIHSRQLRTFVVRALYVAMLTVYIGLMWQAVVEQARADLGQAAAQNVMSDAGRRIVSNVILFQFIAGQVAAIALMCTSFSDELSRGRLPTLLTTPMSPVQIIAGKYLSRLVQLLVLMLATLPVLGIVRVFGGVPWPYLLLNTIVAVLAALFVGAVTMLASMKQSKPHLAAWRGALASAGVTVGFMIIFGLSNKPGAGLQMVIAYLFAAILLAVGIGSAGLMCVAEFPRAVQRTPSEWQPSAPPLSDKSYANYAWLPPIPDDPNFRSPFHTPAVSAAVVPPPPEEIQGPPLIWRATRRLNKSLTPRALMTAVGLILIYTYGGALAAGGLDSAGLHYSILNVLLVLVALWAGFLAATSITVDKESGQWPLLLTTPLDNTAIFTQKVRVILGRSWMLGAVVAAHTILFVLAGTLHPLALIQLPMLFAWQGLFVIALGVYCSARGRSSSSAALVTGAVLATLWLVLPVTAPLIARGIADDGSGFIGHAARWISAASPFTQLSSILSGDLRSDGSFHAMRWLDGQKTIMGPLEYLFQSLFWAIVYALAALALARQAIRSFRRDLYE